MQLKWRDTVLQANHSGWKVTARLKCELPWEPQKLAIQVWFPSNPDLLRLSSSCSSRGASPSLIVKATVTSTLPDLKREDHCHTYYHFKAVMSLRVCAVEYEKNKVVVKPSFLVCGCVCVSLGSVRGDDGNGKDEISPEYYFVSLSNINELFWVCLNPKWAVTV